MSLAKAHLVKQEAGGASVTWSRQEAGRLLEMYSVDRKQKALTGSRNECLSGDDTCRV